MIALVAIGALIVPAELGAQERPRRPRASARSQQARPNKPTVLISYPDSVDLSAFVDYVSQSLDVKIIYGDEVKSQRVIFRPGEIEVPRTQLLALLRSMLRMHDLALIDADIEGWLRIVRADDTQRHVSGIRRAEVETGVTASNRIVTQVVRIASNDISAIRKHAERFLSSGKATVIEVPDKKLLIITDYETSIAKAVEIIRLIDADPVSVRIVTVPVRHYDPKVVGDRVVSVLAERAKLEQRSASNVAVLPDLANENLLVVGGADDIERVEALIQRFDVAPQSSHRTEAYTPKHMSVARFLNLVENLLTTGSGPQESMKLLVDEERNRLYATATAETHGEIAQLLEAEDVPLEKATRPLKIYKPRNRPARDLINILSEVLPNISSSTAANGEDDEVAREAAAPPGPNRPPAPPGQPLPVPPAQEPIHARSNTSAQVRRIQGVDFVLSYDEHTNAIIAIGPQEFHARLTMLMEVLDQRQAQILIEMTLVAITFNDSLSLAMELANQESFGDQQSLVFSSFGLSGVDLATGKRTFRPGGGINAVLLGPYETPIVVRAIAAHGNSRVVATPRILVGNNTTATIGSVEEAPFTSVNASDTVATTSFAGFESAGTTLTVTPHVMQDDYLSLDYSFSFSNFTGSGSVGVPPPRTTNSFSGTIEIPDRYTAIVGGLVSENETDSVTEVPILGRIPFIGVFFQSSDRIRTKSRVYAFIRPTILHDDEFADLKLITLREIERAELVDRDFPESEYAWMR